MRRRQDKDGIKNEKKEEDIKRLYEIVSNYIPFLPLPPILIDL